MFGAVQPSASASQFLRGAGKLIWMRRRDRIAQAVSRAIAVRTNVWSSESPRFRGNPAVEVDLTECVRTLGNVCADEAGWTRLIKAAKVEVLEIYYEDLVARYEQEARKVLHHLGIGHHVASVPQPPLERQANDLNVRLRGELCAYLGLS